jgi:hypothetical protein
MKRSMCGGFLLATLAGMVACSGDPTGDLVGAGLTIQANPSSLFMAQDETKPVDISVVDKQGNEADITGFQVQPGSGVSAVEDTAFLPTNAGVHLNTSKRINVTGTAPGATAVTINANGTTYNIPVKVTPTSTTVTLSSSTPAANEPLVITLPSGYKFGTGAGASLGGAAGIVQSVAADSSSITVLLPPGGTGAVTVDSVQVDFVPGVLFSLPTPDSVTVGLVTPQTGTNSVASAPTLTLPPTDDGALAFFDGGTYDFSSVNGPARLYKFVVTDSVDLTTTVDWPSTEDLGLYFYAADGATDVGATPADAGGAGAHPETATNTFAPGTYIMGVTNFSATNPAYYGITISATTPVAAE